MPGVRECCRCEGRSSSSLLSRSVRGDELNSPLSTPIFGSTTTLQHILLLDLLFDPNKDALLMALEVESSLEPESRKADWQSESRLERASESKSRLDSDSDPGD